MTSKCRLKLRTWNKWIRRRANYKTVCYLYFYFKHTSINSLHSLYSTVLTFSYYFILIKDLTEAINQRDMNETYAKALDDKYVPAFAVLSGMQCTVYSPYSIMDWLDLKVEWSASRVIKEGAGGGRYSGADRGPRRRSRSAYRRVQVFVVCSTIFIYSTYLYNSHKYILNNWYELMYCTCILYKVLVHVLIFQGYLYYY